LKALAVIEAVTHPTMSRLIASLVRAGWVAKQTDAQDARFQRLTLTEAGLDAWDAARARRVDLISRLVERLSPVTGGRDRGGGGAARREDRTAACRSARFAQAAADLTPSLLDR
jgi:hypothetical protein